MVEQVPVGSLKGSEYNPRTISKHDYESLKRSIKTFGLVEPIVVNQHPGRENIVVGGHQRLKAAQELALPQVPVFFVDLELEQEQALNTALNRIRGEFIADKLPDLLRSIEAKLDLNVTGFTPKELDRALHGTLFGAADEDSFRVEQALGEGPTESQPGEVYDLGPHRLACGDSRDPILMDKLFVAGEKAALIFSDPPYNVAYQGQRLGAIMNDAQSPEDFQKLITDAFANTFAHLDAGAVFYICMGWSSYPALLHALDPLGVHLANVIVWVKDTGSFGWNDYKYSHEIVVKGEKRPGTDKSNILAYGWKDGTHYFAPIRDEADLWYIRKRSARDYLHPTQKPVGLVTRALSNSTKKGDIVVDPFAGAGTTLIAADMMERRARIVELDPKFCDVIRRRWKAYEKAKQEKAAKAGGVQ